MLSDFARSRPGLRLDVRCGLSLHLRRALDRGELDLALSSAIWTRPAASVPGPNVCTGSRGAATRSISAAIPCRSPCSSRGTSTATGRFHALEAERRAWHVAYTSPSIFGIQAAVSAGLGVSILPEIAILPDHRVLGAEDGFPPITDTEVALVAGPEASPATRRLAEALAHFCSAAGP
jgi:DNA-binding transcriptional LysR family regulator